MPNLPYSSTPTLPFGGRTVSITSVTYVARNWKPEKSTRKIRRDDENGDQAAFMLRGEPTAQSGLTLQVPLSTTTVPLLGATFSADSRTWVITRVGKAEPQGEFHTVDIDIEDTALPAD